MAPTSPYLLGVLISVFLTSNLVSSFTLPKFTLLQRSNDLPSRSVHFLERKDVITERGVKTEDGVGAPTSDASWTTVTIYQTVNTTSTQPAPPIALTNSLALGAPAPKGTNIVAPIPPYTSPASTSVAYTTPGQPFTVSNARSGSRRFPTNTITTFATPSFFNVQTVTLTQAITTIYVLGPTRTSVIVNYETITTVSTVTSTGYNCKSTSSIAAPTSASKVVLSGINLSGFESGCDNTGTCDFSQFQSPLTAGYNITGQISHFVNDDGFSTFRLPVSWQYLTGNTATTTGVLNPTNFAAYDELVQACLNQGAYCVIDLHNYGRFDDYLIGQGGATDTAFVALWGALAAKYAKEPYVIFGLMNQISSGDSYIVNSYGQQVTVTWNINTWTATLQSAINAIRAAGAVSQFILLRGYDWAGTMTFAAASANALAKITNPNGPIGKLILDFQLYLDYYGTGASDNCVSSHITDALAPAAQWLRCNGRQALLTELGGGNTNSCLTYMCSAVAYLNANSDVYLGYIGWGAGILTSDSSTLSLTPVYYGRSWTDQTLVQNCLKPSR